MKVTYSIVVASLLAPACLTGCSENAQTNDSSNNNGSGSADTNASAETATGSDAAPAKKKDDPNRYASEPLVALDKYQDVTTIVEATFSNDRSRQEWPNYQRPAAYFWSRIDDAKRQKYAFTFVQDRVFKCAAEQNGFDKRDCVKAHYAEAARIAYAKRNSQYGRFHCSGSISNYDFPAHALPDDTCTGDGTTWTFSNDSTRASRSFEIKRPDGAAPVALNFSDSRNREIQKLFPGLYVGQWTVYGHIVGVHADCGDPQYVIPVGDIEIVPDAVSLTEKGADSPLFVWSLAKNGPVTPPR